jgi:hypothetical protein
VDINEAADILTATSEESDEGCGRAERVRDGIFVDSSACVRGGFIWNYRYFSLCMV